MKRPFGGGACARHIYAVSILGNRHFVALGEENTLVAATQQRAYSLCTQLQIGPFSAMLVRIAYRFGSALDKNCSTLSRAGEMGL